MILSNRTPASTVLLLTLFLAGRVHAQSSIEDLVNALRQGNIAQLNAAIASGTDANARDRYGNTLLMDAAVYGPLDSLAFLLKHGADVNAANPAGHTALMRAI